MKEFNITGACIPKLHYMVNIEGFLDAERRLLVEKNTLFESLAHQLEEYGELRDMIWWRYRTVYLRHGSIICSSRRRT